MKPIYTLILSLTVVACASERPPAVEMMQTRQAIGYAEQSGAQDDALAQRHLERAIDGLVEAQLLLADGEHEEARLVLERATVDADLAQARAELAATRRRAAEASARLSRLRRHAAQTIVARREAPTKE
ncbi:MAG: DUF4398 domain-containing protein [Deltaproteobacteria bacterium]